MKKGKLIGIMIMSAALLTGCGDAMPDLTAEQSDMISEYAAGLLLKYSSKYDYKLVSEEEVAAVRASEALEMEQTQESETTNQDQEGNETSDSLSKEQPSEVEILYGTADTDFAAELGIDDVILKYQSFELCDTYPQDSQGFSVTAAQGRNLLVVHFDLESSLEQELSCNLFDYEMKANFTINDTINSTALNTMLPNELMFYMDTIPAGETVDVVIVAEVGNLTEEAITSLSVQMSSKNGRCAARLKE